MIFDPKKREFLKITLDEFVKNTIEGNSDLNAGELRKSLEEFKKRKNKGELCRCGNPIWVAGSAIVGKGCFTCITGESDCSKDYEIE